MDKEDPYTHCKDNPFVQKVSLFKHKPDEKTVNEALWSNHEGFEAMSKQQQKEVVARFSGGHGGK